MRMLISSALASSILALAFFFPGSAQAQRTIEFTDTIAPDSAVIIGVAALDDLEAYRDVIGEAAYGALMRGASSAGFEPEKGATHSLYSGAASFGEIHLIGVKEIPQFHRDHQNFGGLAAGLAKGIKRRDVTIVAPIGEAISPASVAAGAILGQYSFDKYKSAAETQDGAFKVLASDPAAMEVVWNSDHRYVAQAVNWMRDMQSEPANVLYPEEFVRRVRAQFRGVANVSINVLDVRDMERLGMGAILGVGKGSARPTRMIIVRYNGGKTGAPPLAFVGKGITFDSGGISIKSNKGMWMMKADMSGAAAVMGAVMGLAKSHTPVNVVAVAALAENMPGASAQRPGDVVRTMSGKTIEIMSTDAEGRLVLADAVWYVQERYKPRLLIDVATLTGSVGRALGDEYAGFFTHDDLVSDQLLKAGLHAGEEVWRLPLHPNHFKQIESVIADVKNGDTGAPGASTGAAFIGSFIKEETPWAHLDIAGVDWRDEATPTTPKGASGFGVRLLNALARDLAE